MSEKRLDIQGLRGWAVTLVVLFHFVPTYFPNGYIGVDMFFVISGFLMSMILRRTKIFNFQSFGTFYYRRKHWRQNSTSTKGAYDKLIGQKLGMPEERLTLHLGDRLTKVPGDICIDTAPNLTMLRFQVSSCPTIIGGVLKLSRIKRILPLYYLAMTCILASLFSLLPSAYRAVNIESSRRAILLITNIKKDDPAQRYSRMLSKAEDLFTHTWSLCVEMQWYLLVPTIFLAQRFITRWEKTFFIVIAVGSIVYYVVTGEMSSFYSVFARIWQFCCGIIAHLAHPGKSTIEAIQYHEEETLIQPEKCRKANATRFCSPSHHLRIIIEQVFSRDTVVAVASFCVFSLAVVIPFLFVQFPADGLRIHVTGFSALLIIIGNYHQMLLLSNQISVYIGDISYALYLFHWPVYIIARNYFSETQHALALGLLISFVLAASAYHFFETYYLTWSPYAVFSLLTILGASCAALALQPSNIDVIKFPPGPVDYSKINPHDAAWNMTLMRYLNSKENDVAANLEVPGCVYSKRFLNEYVKPVGFCAMENGHGATNFFVVGNSFACNQAGVIYAAFKQYARQFNVYCYYGCEVMTWTHKEKCWKRVNYTAMVHELRPDVVFVISRSLMAKTPFDTMKPMEEDKIFWDHMRRMTAFEKIVKKVYLLQALPSCIDSCSLEAQKFMDTGRPLREMKEALINRDDFFARQRIQELGRRCRACEIIDYLPVLVDRYGHYLGYNPEDNLLYLDNDEHFTRFGKERLQVLFNQLARNFNISK